MERGVLEKGKVRRGGCGREIKGEVMEWNCGMRCGGA